MDTTLTLLREAAALFERAPDHGDMRDDAWNREVWEWMCKYNLALADARLKPTLKDLEPVGDTKPPG